MTEDTFCKDKETLRGLEDALQSALSEAVKEKFGDKPEEAIQRRLREEWHAMLSSESIADVASIHEVSMWLKDKGYPYYIDHTGGGSFLFYLLGISAVNPLPPHYYCPKCKKVIFDATKRDGFDLQADKMCECGETTMICEGHNIPWQSLWGYGDYRPNFHINVTEDAYDEFVRLTKSNWLLKEVQAVPEYELDHFKNQCVRYARFVVCFSEKSTGIQAEFFTKTVDAATCLSVKCYKQVMSSMGLWYRIVTQWFMNPKSFADLFYAKGMGSRSTQNRLAECFMCKQMGYTAADMIAFREDVYFYLTEHGFVPKDAWRLSERVRKGRGLELITSDMELAKDRWVLAQIERTRYLPAKARTLEKLFYATKVNR